MRLRVVMKPWGFAEYEDSAKSVPVGRGDRAIPSPVDLTLPGVNGHPELTMRVEVIDGVPRCTDIRVRVVDGGREVRTKDLAAVQLENWIELLVGHLSEEAGDWTAGYDRTAVADARAARSGTRKRVTAELLDEVAATYRAAERVGRLPGQSVEEKFEVSQRTALRYIRMCRDRGLLDETARSRRDG